MPCQKMATVESWVFSWKMFKIKKKEGKPRLYKMDISRNHFTRTKALQLLYKWNYIKWAVTHTHTILQWPHPLVYNFFGGRGGGGTNHPDKYSKIFSETKHSRKLRIICWSLLRDIIWHILSSKIIFTWNQIDNIYTYKYFIFNCFIMLMIIKVRFLRCAIHVIQIPRRHVGCLVVTRTAYL